MRAPSGASGLGRGLKRGIKQAAAACPCEHRVDALGCAEDNDLLHRNAEVAPGLAVIGAPQYSGAEFRMHPRP
jgi:hypothetical protein